jgi:hypothetical protein
MPVDGGGSSQENQPFQISTNSHFFQFSRLYLYYDKYTGWFFFIVATLTESDSAVLLFDPNYGLKANIEIHETFRFS